MFWKPCFWKSVLIVQVLSDPKLKQAYDSGEDVAKEHEFMNSATFFAMLFGSTRFEEFVGELMICSIASSGEPDFDRAKVWFRIVYETLSHFKIAEVFRLQVMHQTSCKAFSAMQVCSMSA
jgi:DnaJ-class molecular chaperone